MSLSPRAPLRMWLSFGGLLLGSLLLRAAAGAMGENIQFYFNAINDAAHNPNHPLITLVHARVYPINYSLGGLIIATFFAAELIGALVLGSLSDRFGRKPFIVLGPLFGAVAVQITALTTSLFLLVITRLLEGLSTATSSPATLAYIADVTADNPRLRARLVGFFEVVTIGGVAAGFALGGWLWHTFGPPVILFGVRLTSPAFAVNALLYVLALLILWFGVSESRTKELRAQAATRSLRDTLGQYWRTLSSPEVAGFAPAWIAVNAVLGIWINLSARILTDPRSFPGQLLVGHFTSIQAGNVRALYAVCFVLGIAGWSLFYAGMRKTTVMLIGVGGLFLTCAAMFLINLQPALNAPLVLPLSGLLVLCILIMSGFTPAALAHLADISLDHSETRGAIMGLYSVFLGLGQFVGASLGGPFVDWLGANGMILCTVLLGAVAGALVWRLRATELPIAAPLVERASLQFD